MAAGLNEQVEVELAGQRISYSIGVGVILLSTDRRTYHTNSVTVRFGEERKFSEYITTHRCAAGLARRGPRVVGPV